MKQIKMLEIILYVADQERSTLLYEKIFRQPPDLNVPGMTEFNISAFCKLGLMPNKGIAKIINHALPHPDEGNGIPRCELYLQVEDIQMEYNNAIDAGAREISTIADRDWGDKAGYLADPDGHIIALAQKL